MSSRTFTSALIATGLVAATVGGMAAPANAGPLCTTFAGVTLAAFEAAGGSCVATGGGPLGNDSLPNVQTVLNQVLEPDITLIGAGSFSPGPASAGDEFDGDDLANNFDIDPDTVAGSISFEFLAIPAGTDFITIKQANTYEIFFVGNETTPFTLTHQIIPSGDTSHISTFASDFVPPPPPVPEPASLVLLGSGLLGLGLLRRRLRRRV